MPTLRPGGSPWRDSRWSGFLPSPTATPRRRFRIRFLLVEVQRKLWWQIRTWDSPGNTSGRVVLLASTVGGDRPLDGALEAARGTPCLLVRTLRRETVVVCKRNGGNRLPPLPPDSDAGSLATQSTVSSFPDARYVALAAGAYNVGGDFWVFRWLRREKAVNSRSGELSCYDLTV